MKNTTLKGRLVEIRDFSIEHSLDCGALIALAEDTLTADVDAMLKTDRREVVIVAADEWAEKVEEIAVRGACFERATETL